MVEMCRTLLEYNCAAKGGPLIQPICHETKGSSWKHALGQSARVPGGAAEVVAVAQQREPREPRERAEPQPQRRRREARECVQRQLPEAARQLRGGGHAALVHVPEPVGHDTWRFHALTESIVTVAQAQHVHLLCGNQSGLCAAQPRREPGQTRVLIIAECVPATAEFAGGR